MLDLTKKISNSKLYNKFLKRSKKLEEEHTKKRLLNITEQKIITNYAYITYEFLEKNKIRMEVDYNKVQECICRFRPIFEYIFTSSNLRRKVRSWLKDNSELVEMTMHSGTNRYNKNKYH